MKIWRLRQVKVAELITRAESEPLQIIKLNDKPTAVALPIETYQELQQFHAHRRKKTASFAPRVGATDE